MGNIGAYITRYFDFGDIADNCAKSYPWAENGKLFTVKGRKLFAQGRDLSLFVGNVTKVKIHSEIKLL